MDESIFKTTITTKKPWGEKSQWIKKVKNRIAEFENAIQKRTKANIVEFLGKGSRGMAFLLSNGKVLKLTDDKTEAGSSAILKGKKLKNVVTFYDVFQLGELPIYGIVQEKVDVKQFTRKFDKLCEWLFGFWDSFSARKKTAELSSTDKAFELFKTMFEKNSGLKLDKQPGGEDFVKQLLNGWLELLANNIEFIDITYKNIGKTSGGVIKIFDIGYSKSPGGPIPAIKETKQFADLKLWVERIV